MSTQKTAEEIVQLESRAQQAEQEADRLIFIPVSGYRPRTSPHKEAGDKPED